MKSNRSVTFADLQTAKELLLDLVKFDKSQTIAKNSKYPMIATRFEKATERKLQMRFVKVRFDFLFVCYSHLG